MIATFAFWKTFLEVLATCATVGVGQWYFPIDVGVSSWRAVLEVPAFLA